MQKKEYVVILHGIMNSKHFMHKLAQYIGEQGYEVLNIDYPSTKHPIEELIDIIWGQIEHIVKANKTHFVGYSMGGVLTRTIIAKHRPKNLGRVVQLATPNKGSEVADFWKDNWLFKKFFGPAGGQLTTNQDEIKHLFGKIDYDLGIIAGDASVDPLSSLMFKGSPNDGKVSVESTKVDGMKDHITLKVSHAFFPYSKKVQKQTVHFLQDGKFDC